MFEELQDAIIKGDEEKAMNLSKKFLDEGVEPQKVLKEGLVAGMDVVGARFKAYEMWLPEVILSAKAMKNSTELIKPYLEKSGGTSIQNKIVIATVEGDVHDIGKNLVAMMLGTAGFELMDLGVNCRVSSIMEYIKKENPDIVALSSLLTTSMLALRPTISAIRASGSKSKIIVGGSPITRTFSEESGADGFAPDALRAINLVKNLLEVNENDAQIN